MDGIIALIGLVGGIVFAICAYMAWEKRDTFFMYVHFFTALFCLFHWFIRVV